VNWDSLGFPCVNLNFLQLLFYFSAILGDHSDIDGTEVTIVSLIFKFLVKVENFHPLGYLWPISIGVEIESILKDFDSSIFHVGNI
jgi:hypothetical protein